MAESQVPYVPAWGNVTKVLNKIVEAQTPTRFTQDFLQTKLQMTGGSAMAVIPFLKRTGFLATDGSPTLLYARFRNDAQRGAAAAEALKTGYARFYEVNEYAHELGDSALKGLAVQVTGADQDSQMVKRIAGSFNALKAYADFSGAGAEAQPGTDEAEDVAGGEVSGVSSGQVAGINLGYTINLHLPPTSEIAVFDAIFKSLREHLLTRR